MSDEAKTMTEDERLAVALDHAYNDCWEDIDGAWLNRIDLQECTANARERAFKFLATARAILGVEALRAERDALAAERDAAVAAIDGELTVDCIPGGGSVVAEACRQFTEATRLLPESALDPEFGTLPESVQKLVDAAKDANEQFDRAEELAAEVARLKADSIERQDCAARELALVKAHVSDLSDENARLKAEAAKPPTLTNEVIAEELAKSSRNIDEMKPRFDAAFGTGMGAEAAKQAPPAQGEQQAGIYRKFQVERTDGSSRPGGKHERCHYFVLDWNHDKFAAPAARAYADACAQEYPALAKDLRDMADAFGAGEPAQGEGALLVKKAEAFGREVYIKTYDEAMNSRLLFHDAYQAEECARVLSAARMPAQKGGE